MSLLPDPLPEHPCPQDREEIIAWARQRLCQRDFVILDTETTGRAAGDEVIQIGIIDPDGVELIDTLVRPEKKRRMPKQAQEVHGITMAMLKDAPTLYELAPQILNAIASRFVICYNDEFDMRLIKQTANKYKLTERGRNLPMKSKCAMIAYSQFIGERSRFSAEYAWQKLPRRLDEHHKAVDDCQLTLDLIRELADSRKKGEPVDFDWRQQSN
jgi:DNA polymerase III subunit epsilon